MLAREALQAQQEELEAREIKQIELCEVEMLEADRALRGRDAGGTSRWRHSACKRRLDTLKKIEDAER